MNKYELAVVLSAKLEDDERAAALEKVKGYITRFGGNVVDVDEWGKKRLAYALPGLCQYAQDIDEKFAVDNQNGQEFL